MKLQFRIPLHFFIPALLAIAWGCDDMSKDVVPPDDKIKKAADLSSTMSINGPVLVDVVQGSRLTGNATISIVEQPGRGTLAILSTALLKYTPNADFTSGSDHATYQVCVGGDCDTGRLDFNYVGAATECQVTLAYDRASGLATDAHIVIDVLKNDLACGGQFDVGTLAVVGAPEHGDAAPVDGLIFYYPNDSYHGKVSFIYRVALRSNPDVFYYGLVEVTIQPGATALTAVNDHFTYTAAEFASLLAESGNRVNYTLDEIFGNDVIGGLAYNDLQVSIVSQPSHGEVTYYAGEIFQFSPVDFFTGADSFTYRICNNGQCSEATVQITVTENAVQLQAMPEDLVLTRAQYDYMMTNHGYLYFSADQLLANDELDGLFYSQLQISIAVQPATAQVTYSPEMFRLTPGEGFDGEAFFTYRICYGDVCSTAVVGVTISGW